MNYQHYLLCEAPICADDPNPNFKTETVWYPGEVVCKQGPYAKFQKIQLEINELLRLGNFKNAECGYAAETLESGSV